MIAAFYRENMTIVMVIYAILFFLLGFAILIKYNRKSELRLAKSLWLLAGYGFAHGTNQLLVIIIRLKEGQLSQAALWSLQNTEQAVKAVSFIFVFWLGLHMWLEYHKKIRFVKFIGVALTFSWAVLTAVALWQRNNYLYIGVVDNLSRYMFAFPGFLLAASGLLLQIKEIEKFCMPSLVKNLKGLAVTFYSGAFLVGLIANEPVFPPATVLNRQTFFEFTSVPLIFFRSFFLLFATYFVIRIVDIFEVEREYRLEEALRRQVLVNERERIARELHDGIIQSIYGVGLKLEQASILADKKLLDEAKKQLAFAKEDLNKIIHDIRDYIRELQPDDFSCVSLREGISGLVREFQENVVMQVSLQVEGQQTEELNIIQVNNILHILRELLTNAAKHSRASQVNVRVEFRPQGIVIRLRDDGIGFDPSLLDKQREGGYKQGLENVFYRVATLQGMVIFHTAPGHGTRYEITFPYRRPIYAGGVFVDNPRYFRAGSE